MLLDWLVYHAVEVQEPGKRSWLAHRHADTPEAEERVRARANGLFNQRWRLVENHLREHGPYHLGSRFSLVHIDLLVTSTFSDELAEGDFPAIAECNRLTGERGAIAPMLAQHMAGLERIAEVGVPR